jgi:hypothetical protein
LTKPFSLDDLKQVVISLIENSWPPQTPDLLTSAHPIWTQMWSFEISNLAPDHKKTNSIGLERDLLLRGAQMRPREC